MSSFKHFLTFWYYKMLQASMTFILAKKGKSQGLILSCLGSGGSLYSLHRETFQEFCGFLQDFSL